MRIDKGMEIETLVFGPMFGNISLIRLLFPQHIYMKQQAIKRKKAALTVNLVENNESIGRIFFYLFIFSIYYFEGKCTFC